MNNLSNKQKKQLKGMGHALRPLVIIGQQGMKTSINDEIAIAIKHHQLVKIKVGISERNARDKLIEEIAKTHRAILVQRIGNIALLYRFNPQKGKLEGLD